MMRFYGYKNCSTCKSAQKFLDSTALSYEAMPIVESPPSVAELKRMLKFKNGKLRSLFNTSGQLYRELKLGERLDSMSEQEALNLLSKNGMLVKRPFLIAEKFGLLGFKETEWKTYLKKNTAS